MNRFSATATPLAGLMIILRQQRSDPRGFLSRLFCAEELQAIGWKGSISQINHTQTLQKGTIRGMHFQRSPHSEMKLISCIRGKIWDVAIDIRRDSPTFLQWYGATLSAENFLAFLIPEGFAHGFQTLSDNVELIYCHSMAYHPEAEGGLHANDPCLAIDWPLPIAAISDRDISHPMIHNDFKGVQL